MVSAILIGLTACLHVCSSAPPAWRSAQVPELAVPSDTILPPIPEVPPPEDTLFLITRLDDRGRPFTFYRRLIGVRFEDTVSGAEYYRFVERYQAELVGGEVDLYYFRLPDPGDDWGAYQGGIATIHDDPLVRVAIEIMRSGPIEWPQTEMGRLCEVDR